MSNSIIEKYYIDNLYPNLDNLYKALKQGGESITKKVVKDFLDRQEEQQLTKEMNTRKKDMGHMVATMENQIWLLDIYILQKYVKMNRGYNDVLACMDVFTRKAYCIAMKSKNMDDVYDAFKSIIKAAGDTPQKLITDSDSSFTGGKFQLLLNKYNIMHDTVPIGDHFSLGIIDRFARTFKTKLTKIFLRTKKTNWIDYIDKVVDLYNDTPHTSLAGIAPNKVEDNIDVIVELNKIKGVKNNVVSDLHIGDNVRVLDKKLFQKGTEPRYSKKIYTVENIHGKNITLNNGKVERRRNLLFVVPDTDNNDDDHTIAIVNKENRIARRNKAAGMDEKDIISMRTRGNRVRTKFSS